MVVKAPFLREVVLAKSAQTPEAYPLNLPLFQKGLSLSFQQPVTMIMGENGAGKSSLLEGIAAACGFNPQGGSSNHRYQNHAAGADDFAQHLTLRWLPKQNLGFFFRAESFFNFATYLEALAREEGESAFSPYGGKSLHHMSHGEAFLTFFQHRIQSPGLFILDEPEAALSPQRQLTFLVLLHQAVLQGYGQFLIATHSPILLAYPLRDLLLIKNGRIEPAAYQDTEHFKITKQFLDSPEAFLAKLLRD